MYQFEVSGVKRSQIHYRFHKFWEYWHTAQPTCAKQCWRGYIKYIYHWHMIVSQSCYSFYEHFSYLAQIQSSVTICIKIFKLVPVVQYLWKINALNQYLIWKGMITGVFPVHWELGGVPCNLGNSAVLVQFGKT